MSSVFATLRRKRDKTKGAAPNGTVFVTDKKQEPIFNSTPNLHKINVNVSINVGARGNTSTTTKLKRKEERQAGQSRFYTSEVADLEDAYGEEGDAEEVDNVIFEEDFGERYGGFGSRRASSATESSDGSSKYGKNKGQGSLRHFASMISMANMFGSLKRSKSSKKMVYGSTQDFEHEKREGSDFMRERVAGKSPMDSESVSKSSVQSMESDLDEAGRGPSKSINNLEPGVRTSSSSSDEDNNTNNDRDNKDKRVDNDFKKRNNIDSNDLWKGRDEEEDNRFDYTTTKTEEELKRTKILIQGTKKFNMDPKKGIEFLVEHDILQNTTEDVAKFLKYGEGLSKTAIGNYLGEHVDFNEEVLDAFLDLHNFKNYILVQALRDFLWSFRLPGESQKIDRMMEAFAKRYCQSNPGIFSCTDTCYLLSYSIIMLNTTLHNPSVKDKPTVEQFVQMNRDVDCGKSLDRVYLVQIFNSILTEPFKIPPEDANDLVLTFFNPNIEGWLWKQGGYKTWKRRWFILSNNCLYYFKFTTDKSPRGIIPLENIHAKEVSSGKSNELFPFILYKQSSHRSIPSSDVIKTCKTLSNGTTVLSQYHTITVASISQEERKKWVQSINQNNSNSDFYDVLTLKKRNLELARMSQKSQKPRSQSQTKPCSERKATPQRVTRKDGRKPINTTAINQISVPKFSLNDGEGDEYKFEVQDSKGRSRRDQHHKQQQQHDSYKTYPVFSSHASISSGSAMERDSSYGSFSDISRSRSESRILECSQDRENHNDHSSLSSVENDTGSLGSRGGSSIGGGSGSGCIIHEEKSVDPKDSRYDLPKKLSVIEESQNQSDRSSSSSSTSSSGAGAVNNLNKLKMRVSKVDENPITLGYRQLSEEDMEVHLRSHGKVAGAHLSDSEKCDNENDNRFKRLGRSDTNHNRTYELSTSNVPSGNARNNIEILTANTAKIVKNSRYSRSRSIESDV